MKFSRERLEEIGWLSGGQLATLILSIISIKLMTSIGPDEYGHYTLAASIAGVLSLGFFGPLEQGYIRFFFDYAKEQKLRQLFCKSLLRLLGYSLLALLVISVVSGVLLYVLLQLDLSFTAAAALMITASLLSVPLNGMMNAMRLRREVAMIQVVERVLIIVLLYLLLSRVSSDATIVMFAIAAATGISLCLRAALFRKASILAPESNVQETPDLRAERKEIYRKVTQYSLPFVLWGGISWLQSSSERWVINGMLTSADVGRYGLAANIINSSAVLLFNIFTQFITPIIFSNFAEERSVHKALGLIRIYTWVTLFLFGFVAVVLFLFGGFLIPLLSSKAFAVDSSLLLLLTFGIGMFYLGQTLTTVGLALKKPQTYVAAKVVSALLSIVFYIAGCHWFGILGIAYAIVLVNVIYFGLIVVSNRSLEKSFV